MEKIRLVLDRNDGSAAEVKAQLIVTQSKLDSALVTIKDLRQQIADMENPDPEPEPEPLLPLIRGACPRYGQSGTGVSAQQNVQKVWGANVFVRQFLGALTQVGPRASGLSGVHLSWKPTKEADITETSVRNAVKNLIDGKDYAEVWHEIDVKVNGGSARAPMVAMNNKFYDTMHKIRPGVPVVNTVGWWCMAKGNTSKTNRLMAQTDVKCDVLGIDADGIKTAKIPYTNFVEKGIMETGELVSYLKARPDVVGISFPEFSTPRETTQDPEGVQRGAWLKEQRKAMEGLANTLTNAVGRPIQVFYCALFEYNFPTNPGKVNSFDKPAEMAAWK